MVDRQPPRIEIGIHDAKLERIARHVVLVDAIRDAHRLVVPLRLGKGQSRTEVPTRRNLRLRLRPHLPGGEHVDVVPAVEDGIVPTKAIPTVHVAEGINDPQVIQLVLVFDDHIHAFRAPRLHNEVLALTLRHRSEFVSVREKLVAVGIGQLREPLRVGFHIDIDPLGQVELEAADRM